ncbi:MAG: CehA/McbA family metallohydrolase [Planctomycetota bacterium]|jgi:hypothetical protein
MRPFRVRATALALCVLSSLVGCGDGDDDERSGFARPAGDAGSARWVAGAEDLDPFTARRDILAGMAADVAYERHPSDGGGAATLVLEDGDDGSVMAGDSRSWTLRYEAGELGISEGGVVYLQVPAFWGWSTPQVEAPGYDGYTTVTTEAEGIRLESMTADRQLLAIRIGGRPLEAGEAITIEYGAGPRGALADNFAEQRSPFMFAVDGDGDGIRSLIEDPPTITVHAGPPSRLVATVTSTAQPGDTVRLTLAVLDRMGNTGCRVEGDVTLDLPEGLEGPESVALALDDMGRKSVELTATEPGVYRVRAKGPSVFHATSNPLQVSDPVRRVLWADLHGHSNLSDGTGTPGDYYRYARDVAQLDVAALSDHDHWGFYFLDAHADMWEEIRAQTTAFHEPGRFVTLLAYEWTSWIHGHRHVLYFDDAGEVLSTLDERYETPRQLWDALEGRDAMTVAHHSAGGPVATNWSFAPDPVLEPVTEIISVHGSSEAADSPHGIGGAVPGNFARDALDAGYRLGFIGSGDSHDGHPGLPQLAAARGGLAAILSDDLTREGILEALRARRTYATSGPRILLRATLDGKPMGSTVAAGDAVLSAMVLGTDLIDRIEIIRSGEVVERRVVGDRQDFLGSWDIERLEEGEYVYLRVVQLDSGLAWSSPFFVQ